ncbi:hypothetical protein P389DRAFT_165103 [Cystobasidium minutum MCA 4210]|uniref:uncharacterized protein n=1 Tax=Cystobasidium minutum MCA 4210 TaxID=1397322 RepID=UPI0034CE33C4|eukprot:jgi/Rhomi1/165103/fgenesh1_kg.1_\
MNVVREIERINKAEIERIASGTQGGSWHDEYKDSAHIFIGGLPTELTEGDVITIFSQYGEPVDINLPRDKTTGKTRGFGFLMYEDQRSTILAVDNLNGAKVLNRTLRVDHVKDYKHLEKGEDGKFKEAERETFNARPDLFMNQNKGSGSDDSEDEGDDNLLEGIDPDDPMAAYLISQRKEERALAIANGSYKSKKSKHKGESKEERRRRKEERRRKREEKDRRGEGSRSHRDRARSRSRSPDRSSRHRREDSRERSTRSPRRREDSRDYDDKLRRYRDEHSDSDRDYRSRSPRDSPGRADRGRPDRDDNDTRRRRNYSPDERDYGDRRRRERSGSRSRDRY